MMADEDLRHAPLGAAAPAATIPGFRLVQYPIQHELAEVRAPSGEVVWRETGNWEDPRWDLGAQPPGSIAVESFHTPRGSWRILSGSIRTGPAWEAMASVRGKEEARVFLDLDGTWLRDPRGACDVASLAGGTPQALNLDERFRSWQREWESAMRAPENEHGEPAPAGGWKRWLRRGLGLSRRLAVLLGPDALVVCRFLGSLGNGHAQRGLALYWEPLALEDSSSLWINRDPLRIPPGCFCYRVFPVADGERLSQDSERFGMDLREYAYAWDLKEVLCPYWFRTGRGTVRCEFLGLEVLDDLDFDAVRKLAAHLGTADRPPWLSYSSDLSDEYKICDIRESEDLHWPSLPAPTPAAGPPG